MSTGGSIESVSIRGRTFAVAADADASRKLGGFSNALEMNGNGTARVIKTREGWALTGIVVDVNDTRADQEFLQDIADGVNADVNGFFTMGITYASGATYSGRGILTEQLEYSSMKTTCSLSLQGPGELTKQ